jgi:ribosome-associated protein
MHPELQTAIQAAQGRKALDIKVLDLQETSSFTDYFLVCSGTSSRHIQAVADAIREELEKVGVRPDHVEGFREGKWVLMDYLKFVVHIFSPEARDFYDLERLWRNAGRVPVPEGSGGAKG